MGTVRDYKDLTVWQRGIELAKLVYTVAARLPAAEQSGLIAHLRRAAVRLSPVAFRLGGWADWLGSRDSNPNTVVQSHVSCRWTTPQ